MKIRLGIFVFLVVIGQLFAFRLAFAQAVLTSPRDSYTTALEETVDILSKTNESLTQRWTPVNILLTVLAVLFTIVTILWGVVFAFGYIAFGEIERHRKALVLEREQLSQSNKAVITSFQEDLTLLVEKTKDTSKSLEEKEKQLSDFQEKAESAINKLGQQNYVTVSDSVSGPGVITSFFANRGMSGVAGVNGAVAAQVCSKCGNLFQPNTTSSLSYTLSFRPLCQQCRDKSDSSTAAGTSMFGLGAY